MAGEPKNTPPFTTRVAGAPPRPPHDLPFPSPTGYTSAKTPKGPKAPKTPKTPKGPKAKPSDPYTTAALADINPELVGLQHGKADYDKTQLAYQAQMTNFYKALGGLLQGQAPAVSGAYNAAAGAVGALGQGLTGDAAKQFADQNAATQAALARGGQTQASDYSAGKANPGGAALNPFYSETALSPGESLAGTGAARATEAAAQPGIWAARGRDSLTEAIQKAVEGDSQWQQKIADVYAKVPGLRQQILSTAQDMELKKRQLADSEQALGIKTLNTKSEIEARLATIKQNSDQLTANIAHWKAQLQDKSLDRASRQQIASQRVQAQKELAVYRAQQQKALALWKKQNGIGGSGGTKSEDWQHVSANIGKQAEYLFNHPLVKGAVDPVTGQVGQSVHQKPQKIFNALWSQYVNPYLSTVPVNQRATARAQAKRAVLNAMSAAGFPLPGRG